MNSNLLFLSQLTAGMKSKKEIATIPTAQLGELSGMSQQSAARRLKELEDDGLIRRVKTGRGQGVVVTEKGIDELNELYSSLKAFLKEEQPETKITGTLSRGLGEGAYYVNEYGEEIKNKLSYMPFPGTLNVKTSEPFNPDRLLTGIIKGFKKKNRTFGSIRYAPVKISSKEKSENGHLIVPARTHHKGILEIICQYNLRETLGVEDGDVLSVEFIQGL
jgi:riboflavin kinase, archaea type